MALEVALAEVSTERPGQVILLARSTDPRLIAVVQGFFEGTWPALVPSPGRSHLVARISDRRRERGPA